MDACVKSIGIGKKDAIIHKWRETVKNQEERMVSFIVKQALLSFVKTGNFIEVGRIHFDPKKDVVSGRLPPINLWLDDTPELIEWVNVLNDKKIPISKAVKEILHRSIKVVPTNEDEYIPSYYDFMQQTNSVIQILQTTSGVIDNDIQKNTSYIKISGENSKDLKTRSSGIMLKKDGVLNDMETKKSIHNKDEQKPDKKYNIIEDFNLGCKR